jgi:hypothetical protein
LANKSDAVHVFLRFLTAIIDKADLELNEKEEITSKSFEVNPQ